MKETEKDSKAPATHTAASSQSLASKKKFSWLLALPVVILVALVGVVIVINTFAATRSQQYVVDLYKGLLGRTVTANDSGVQYWAKKIDSGTSEAAVYTAIYNSTEAKNYRQKLINNGYGSSGTSGSGTTRSSGSTSTGTQTSNYAAELAWVKSQCSALKLSCGTTANENRAKALAANKTTRAKILADLKSLAVGTKDQTSSKNRDSGSSNISAEACKKKLKKDFGSYYISSLGADLSRDLDHINGHTVRSVVNDAVSAVYARYTTDGSVLKVENAVNKIMVCNLTIKQLIAEVQSTDTGKAKAARDNKIRQARKDIVAGLWNAYASAMSGKTMNQLCAYMYEKNKAGENNGGPGPQCWAEAGIGGGKTSNPAGDAYRTGAEAVADGSKTVDQVVSEVLDLIKSGSSGASCSELGEAASSIPSCAAGEEYVSQSDYDAIQNGTRPNGSNSNTTNRSSNSPYSQKSGTTTVDR